MVMKLKSKYFNLDVAVDITFGILNTYITFCIYLFDFSEAAFEDPKGNNGMSIMLRPL